MSLSCKPLHSLQRLLRRRRLYRNADNPAFARVDAGRPRARLRSVDHDNFAIVAGFWR
jgi:hypothetical protein